MDVELTLTLSNVTVYRIHHQFVLFCSTYTWHVSIFEACAFFLYISCLLHVRLTKVETHCEDTFFKKNSHSRFSWQPLGTGKGYPAWIQHSSLFLCCQRSATLAISTLLAFTGWCLIHYNRKISHQSQAASALTCQYQGGCKKVTDGCQSPALHQDTDKPSVPLPYLHLFHLMLSALPSFNLPYSVGERFTMWQVKTRDGWCVIKIEI